MQYDSRSKTTEENIELMHKVSVYVDLKLDESIHGRGQTQDESIQGGLASMHDSYKTQDESTRREDVSIHAAF